MRVRWLGHSCIEILGKKHILIDPDYLREPLPDIDYIFITHGHEDHLGKVAEIQAGAVLAAKDVCEIARGQGV
ncbi:MAG: MBL fold metallo-hydrolase, partial [Anaerolineae bacterium]|nr:MBL fold metallo-hydrolase [Anaerolineae bacterium]